MRLTSPVTNCHTSSDPLPLERDVLYERPLRKQCMAMMRDFNYPINWEEMEGERKKIASL